MFKQLVVLISFLTIVAANIKELQELREYFSFIHATCKEKIGITESEFKSYRIKDEHPAMMCYMKCILTETRVMHNNGTIRYDFIYSSAPEEIILAAKKCENIPDSDDICEKAYFFELCMYNADPQNWYLI